MHTLLPWPQSLAAHWLSRTHSFNDDFHIPSFPSPDLFKHLLCSESIITMHCTYEVDYAVFVFLCFSPWSNIIPYYASLISGPVFSQCVCVCGVVWCVCVWYVCVCGVCGMCVWCVYVCMCVCMMYVWCVCGMCVWCV